MIQYTLKRGTGKARVPLKERRSNEVWSEMGVTVTEHFHVYKISHSISEVWRTGWANRAWHIRRAWNKQLTQGVQVGEASRGVDYPTPLGRQAQPLACSHGFK